MTYEVVRDEEPLRQLAESSLLSRPWAGACEAALGRVKRQWGVALPAVLVGCAVVCVAAGARQTRSSHLDMLEELSEGLFSERVSAGSYCGGGRLSLDMAATSYKCVALALVHSQCQGYINYYPVTQGCYCASREACTGENQIKSTSSSNVEIYRYSLSGTTLVPPEGKRPFTTKGPSESTKDVCGDFPAEAAYGCDSSGDQWHKLSSDGDEEACLSRCRTGAVDRGSICCLVRQDIGCYMKPHAPVTNIPGEDIGKAVLCTEEGAEAPPPWSPPSTSTVQTTPAPVAKGSEPAWVLGPPGESCSEACRQKGLTCDELEFSMKNYDVDTHTELNELVDRLGGECKFLNDEYGTQKDVPVYVKESGWCGVSKVGRTADSFECDAKPAAVGHESKMRVCWCTPEDERPSQHHVPDAQAFLLSGMGLDPVTQTTTTTATTASTGPPTTTIYQVPADEYHGPILSGDVVYLQARTKNYVMVQEGSLVEARYAQRGQWQELLIEKDQAAVGDEISDDDPVFLKGHNGKYLGVHGIEVQANSEQRGSAERLTVARKDHSGSMHYQDTVFFKTSKGKYLDVNPDVRFLEAEWPEIGDWQAFTITRKPPSGDGSPEVGASVL